MVRRVSLVLGGIALLLLIVGGVLAHRLLYTQAGLEFALEQLHRVPGVRIEVSGAEGTIAGPLDVARLVVDHEALHLEAQDLHVALQARALLAGAVHLRDLSIGRAAVRLKERPEQPKKPPGFLPAGLRIVRLCVAKRDETLREAARRLRAYTSGRAA